MTIQTAARDLLHEEGKPLSSRELARRALDRGMVTSKARDPIESHAQALEKNIRSGIYNSPQMAFVFTTHGRMIGLPEWGDESTEATEPATGQGHYGTSMPVRIPAAIVEQIKLAAQARIGATFDDTVAHLLRVGLREAAPDIKAGILEQVEALDREAFD